MEEIFQWLMRETTPLNCSWTMMMTAGMRSINIRCEGGRWSFRTYSHTDSLLHGDFSRSSKIRLRKDLHVRLLGNLYH